MKTTGYSGLEETRLEKTWAVLDSPLEDKLKGVPGIICAVLFAIVLVGIYWWSERPLYHAARARELVQQSYTSEAGDSASDRSPWRQLSQQYGRVVRFHVGRQRLTFLKRTYLFEVQVERERARQIEVVSTTAASNGLGEWTHVDEITVEPPAPDKH